MSDIKESEKTISTESTLSAELAQLLQECKNAISVKDKLRLLEILVNKLKQLPPEYKSLVLRIDFSDIDPIYKTDYIENLKTQLGINPVDGGNQYIFDIQLLTPRDPGVKGISSKWGSPLRQRYNEQGAIQTLKIEPVCLISINPVCIGAYSTDKRMGVYTIFPKNLIEINLSIDFPTYLTGEEKEYVNDFYQQTTE